MSGAASSTVNPIQYRPDIDGLRAIAVLAVVAYHAGIPGVGGGFVGVDVFFVISGYLITRLLEKELLESGRISLWGFYDRRMRRLLPALAAMIVVTVALNCALFPGFIDVRRFAASVRWSSFGFANVYFKRNTGGYFDGAAEEMPLLHLWSLGVEEQFYLAWPLLLTLGRNRARGGLLLAAVVLASFVAASFATLRGNAPAAFYLAPYRAWELGVGALLVFLPEAKPTKASGRRDTLASLAGLVLIVAAVCGFRSTTVFPAPAAALPALGAALLIRGGARRANPVGAALGWGPLVRIGVLSYGWYLWHWPLLVAARFLSAGDAPSAPVRIGMLLLALLFADLSLRWLETPLRRPRAGTASSSRRVVACGLLTCALILSGSFAIRAAQDFVLERKLGPERVRQLHAVTALDGKCFDRGDIGAPECTVAYASGKGPAPLVAIWGDSHACSYFALLETFGARRRADVTQYCKGQNPPLAGTEYARAVFEDLHRRVSARAPAPVSVILVARWTAYVHAAGETGGADPAALRALRERLTQSIAGLRSAGVSRVLLILPFADFSSPTIRCLSRDADGCRLSRSEVERQREPTVRALREVVRPFEFVRVIDPVPALCDGDSCPQVRADMPVVVDTNHPSVAAVRAVGSFYSSELDRLLP